MIAAPKDMYGTNVFDLLVDDIGEARSAMLLEVTRRTVRRWRTGVSKVPRMAVLALYWESQWGRSQIATSHFNEVRNLYGLVESQRQEILALSARVVYLEQDGPRSANCAWYQPVILPPAPAPSSTRRLQAYYDELRQLSFGG